MKHVDVAGISSDPGKRMTFLCDFVGLNRDDWNALQESVAVLGPKLPAILDALYDHLLSFDDTHRIFLGAKGELDPGYIALRKEHLTEWILKTVQAGPDGGFAAYLVSVGRSHTGAQGEPGRAVPPRYMVALASFVQTALTSTAFAALPGETERALRISLAWNKMMMVQLEFFLKVMAPEWPHWDEELGFAKRPSR